MTDDKTMQAMIPCKRIQKWPTTAPSAGRHAQEPTGEGWMLLQALQSWAMTYLHLNAGYTYACFTIFLQAARTYSSHFLVGTFCFKIGTVSKT